MTTAKLDQSVDSVRSDGAKGSIIYLRNRGTMVMPAELEITFDGGAKSVVKLPVEMWNLGPVFEYHTTDSRRVQRVVIDPRQALPDVDRRNNAWGRG